MGNHDCPSRIRFPGSILSILFCALLATVLGSGQETDPPAEDAKEVPREVSEEDSKEDSKKDGKESKEGDKILAGHSFHGEVFNEGPRQKAYLMGGTGKVHIEVTTKVPEVQKFFDQGVGQLHGFWYFEAERSFRHAASLDPDCAMAYWGMAMANFDNQKRAKGFIAEARERKESASDREKFWIDGYADYVLEKEKDKKKRRRAYIRSLEKILHEYPDELEARAFLVVRLWQFKGDLPISSYEAVSALLDQILAVEPMHPAHHFRIHLWDHEKPDRALRSAARCGQSSPSIAHMWHMPGHIYSRLKRYGDAAWQQEASARVDHAQMARDRLLPDQIHNYAHNNEWLIRNLIHVGRARDAVNLAKNLIELPRHPRYNTMKRRGRSASYGRSRLFDVLRKFELWDELTELADTVYLEPTDIEREQNERLRALGRAAYGRGEARGLREQISRLEGRRARIDAGREEALSKAEKKARKKAQDDGKSDEDIEKAVKKAREKIDKEFDGKTRPLKAPLGELALYEAVLSGEEDRAKELLGKSRGLSKIEKSRLHRRLGDEEKACELAREAVDSAQDEVLPLANCVDILWSCGDKEEARGSFEKLREISSHLDIGTAPFARLTPVAVDLGYESDWRAESESRDDVGERPDLDTIGPFRWTPQPAPDWTLSDGLGNEKSLSDYRGKPVVVIFYLGAGCLHCVEQLEAFAPKLEEFEKRGITMVAISTETVKQVQENVLSFDLEGESSSFPIPIVANDKLDVFKLYRAYDDFEKQPLHGTFLIDAAGLVHWQDISYEPFTDADFLLREARRLLGDSESLSQSRKVGRF